MIRRDFLLSGIVAGTLSAGGLLPTGVHAVAPVPLRAVAGKRGFRFGAAIDVADLARPDMVKLFTEHCSSLTPRNALKWETIGRDPGGRLDFSGPDKIVDFAQTIGCGVYGTALVWYRVPKWVTAITDKGQLRDVMRHHITQTLRHYGDKVYAWDVVNEPLLYDQPMLRPSVFQTVLGEDHIAEALQMAHQANPRAQLVINETHMEKRGATYDARRTFLLQLVERLKAKNAPLHAIGLQAHFRPGLDDFDPVALANLCRALKRMGVGVYVTELDASCRFTGRLRTSADDAYAEVFGGVVRAAGAGDLRGVTTWGLAEKYGSTEQGAAGVCRTRVLLYDEAMQPRSTLAALEKALAI